MEYTITIPSQMEGFIQHNFREVESFSSKTLCLMEGEIENHDQRMECPHCKCMMHVHDVYNRRLRHLPFSNMLLFVDYQRYRFMCPECGEMLYEDVPFQHTSHRITDSLYTFTSDLLAYGFTNKQVAEITGLSKNTVKAIDMERLQKLYTVDGKTLRKPERQARRLGVDEFKLHDGHVFATVIIDLDTGHVLWLAHGKKKKAVYDFIDFVGLEWMSKVEAVACDMNSDYEEAFRDTCGHLAVVFDYFHIRKNFNEKVIAEIRKEEQARLKAEGKTEEAAHLKKSKYVLTSSRETLERKDKKAESQVAFPEDDDCLFKGGKKKVFKDGNVERYEQLISENKLLLTADLIKEKLSYAYKLENEADMRSEIEDMISICNGTENEHFKWFARLLSNHIEGIVSHAKYRISSGKVEGTNNMIKTLRRTAYGYPDDDYFFLKIMDASRKSYTRNPKSHKFGD